MSLSPPGFEWEKVLLPAEFHTNICCLFGPALQWPMDQLNNDLFIYLFILNNYCLYKTIIKNNLYKTIINKNYKQSLLFIMILSNQFI